VTERVLPELLPALVGAADAVRGLPPIDGAAVLGELLAARPELAAALLPSAEGGAGAAGPLEPGSDQAAALLGSLGLLGGEAPLATRLAPVLALVEVLPRPLTERLLVELLARAVEPVEAS
jgi:hypothetical protein